MPEPTLDESAVRAIADADWFLTRSWLRRETREMVVALRTQVHERLVETFANRLDLSRVQREQEGQRSAFLAQIRTLEAKVDWLERELALAERRAVRAERPIATRVKAKGRRR